MLARTGASVGKSYIYRDSDGLVYYAGFLIRARIREEYDAEFVFQSTLTDKYNKYIAVTSQRSGQPGMNAQEYSEFEIRVPEKEEQTKIGTYFRILDHLITLHQRKNIYFYEKVTLVWEQRKLGDVLVSLQNNTLSRADLSNEAGVAKNVHYGDVLIKFGEVLDVSKEQLPMISDESILTKYKTSFLQNGDVIIADTAEDTTVGKCSEIVGLNDEVVLSGLHTIPYRPVEKFAPKYLGYYLNSDAYHNQLLPLMQGIKVTSISKSAMQDTDIIYPKSKEEQTEIGNYFDALDHLITLHQCKCHLLHKLLHNDWEQRKFSEFVKNVAVRNKAGVELECYAVTNDRGFISQKEAHDAFGYMADADTTAYNIVPPSSFAYNPARINVGSIGYYTGIENVIVSSLYEVFQTADYVDDRFMWHWFKSDHFSKWIERLQEGSVRLYFYYDKLIQCEMKMPSLEEQKKMGAFFDQLDHLITLHHRKYIYILKSP